MSNVGSPNSAVLLATGGYGGGAGSPSCARVKTFLHNLWPSDASKMMGIHTNTKFKIRYKERCVLNPICGLSLSH